MSRRDHPAPPPPLPKPGDNAPPAASGDKAGYIRILPRTGTPPYVYQKQCETCNKTHDGTFGAGRFCSSRCARTVGGLAHRRKRLIERSMSKHPGSSSSKHGGSSSKHGASTSVTPSCKPKDLSKSGKPPKPGYGGGGGGSSKRKQTSSRMTISALLNPT